TEPNEIQLEVGTVGGGGCTYASRPPPAAAPPDTEPPRPAGAGRAHHRPRGGRTRGAGRRGGGRWARTASPRAPHAVDSACELPAHQVLSTLSVLEMRRLLRRLGGNRIVRL